MAVKPEDLAEIMASSISRNTYLSTRGYITDELQAAILQKLSPADKEKYQCSLYRILGYQEFKGDTGYVFMKGSQKRFVPLASKRSVKKPTETDVSLYWQLS